MATSVATQELDSADRALVAELSAQFRPALQRYFWRRRLPVSDVDDAIQEVFLRLSRRRGLAGMANATGYLFETAASVAIDHQRRSTLRATNAHDSFDDQIHAPADHATDVVFESREELRLLQVALLELPERTRTVFVLARLEQMRQAEIARRLGISVSAVEKHLVKALAHLAQRVGRQP